MPVNTAQPFNAVLKHRETGETLARGHATVLVAQKAVRFESDFVPLYPIGTPMEILRLHSGKEIHRFWGTVYLSDKRLMRIVSVEDELLPGSEQVYCHNFSFSAVLAQSFPQKTETGFLDRFRQKQVFQEYVFTAPITEIADTGLTFTHDVEKPFEVGQKFLMKAILPLPVPETMIEISKALCFGSLATYECAFTNLSQAAKDNLRYFLKQYHLKKHKLF